MCVVDVRALGYIYFISNSNENYYHRFICIMILSAEGSRKANLSYESDIKTKH